MKIELILKRVREKIEKGKFIFVRDLDESGLDSRV